MNLESHTANRVTVDKIIDQVRMKRDGLISELLDDTRLREYFQEHFGRAISPLKVEFLKRDLKALKESAIDLVHYSKLITGLKDSNVATLGTSDKEFYDELDLIFQKYRF